MGGAEDPHGWRHFWGLYHSGRWEPETRQLIRDVLRPGSLFVDIGAWIGPTVLWALETGATVVAVEPDPIAWPELRTQVQASGMSERVEIHNCAIGPQTGPGWLQINPKAGGAYGDSMSRLADSGAPVDVRTLSDVLDGRRPDLVKIDIEGGEVVLWGTLVPWLAAQATPLQMSCHGQMPDRGLFQDAGYRELRWPDHTWGDIVALP